MTPADMADKREMMNKARADRDMLGIQCQQVLKHYLAITNNRLEFPWYRKLEDSPYIELDQKSNSLSYVWPSKKWRIPVCWKKGCKNFSQDTDTLCCRPHHDEIKNKHYDTCDEKVLDMLSDENLSMIEYFLIGVHLARSPMQLDNGLLAFDRLYSKTLLFFPKNGDVQVKCSLWKCQELATLISHSDAYCDGHLDMQRTEKLYRSFHTSILEGVILALLELSVILDGGMACPWEKSTWNKIVYSLKNDEYFFSNGFFKLTLSQQENCISYRNTNTDYPDVRLHAMCKNTACFSSIITGQTACFFHTCRFQTTCLTNEENQTLENLVDHLKLKFKIQQEKNIRFNLLASALSILSNKSEKDFANTSDQRKELCGLLKTPIQLKNGIILWVRGGRLELRLLNSMLVFVFCDSPECLEKGVLPVPCKAIRKCFLHHVPKNFNPSDELLRLRVLASVRKHFSKPEANDDEIWEEFLRNAWNRRKMHSEIQLVTSEEIVAFTGINKSLQMIISSTDEYIRRHVCSATFCLRQSLVDFGQTDDYCFDVEKCRLHFMAKLCEKEKVKNMFYNNQTVSSLELLQSLNGSAEYRLVNNAVSAVFSRCNMEFATMQNLKQNNQLLLVLQRPITYKCLRIWSDETKICYVILDGSNNVKNTCSLTCPRQNLGHGCSVHSVPSPVRIRMLVAEKVKKILNIPEMTVLSEKQLADFRRVVLHSTLKGINEALDSSCSLLINDKEQIAIHLVHNSVNYPLCQNFGQLSKGKVCNGYSVRSDALCSFCKSPGLHLGLLRRQEDNGSITLRVMLREKRTESDDANTFRIQMDKSEKMEKYWSLSTRSEAVRKKAAILLVAAFEREERKINVEISMNAQFEDANLVFADLVAEARNYGMDVTLVPATTGDEHRAPKYFTFSKDGDIITGNSYPVIYEFDHLSINEDWRYVGVNKYKPGGSKFANCHLNATTDQTAAGLKLSDLIQRGEIEPDEYMRSTILAHCSLDQKVSQEGVETIFILSRMIMSAEKQKLVLGNLQFYTPGTMVNPLPVDFLQDLNCILIREIGKKIVVRRIKETCLLEKVYTF